MDNSSTLGINQPSGSPNSPNANEIAEQTRRQQSGANWFFWIAALSLINSVIVLMGGRWSFLAGLGVTQIIDGFASALAREFGGAATAIALLLDLGAAAVVTFFGLLARQRHSWAFIIGMAVYVLDGVLFVLVQDWLPAAFHAYALFYIYRGLVANNRLTQLARETGGLSADTA